MTTKDEHVAAARNGDRSAFAALYVAHHGAVELRLLRLVGRGPGIDDLVQETFVRAFSALRSFRGDGPFRAWLLVIATRVARSAQRGVQRSLWRLFASDDEERALALASTDASPDAARVRHALFALSPKLQEAVVMYELEGRTLDEIATLLDVPLPTVAARVRRGREALRERILRGAALLVVALLVVSAARAWMRTSIAPPAVPTRVVVPPVPPRPVTPTHAPAKATPRPHARRKKQPLPAPVPVVDEPFGDVIEVARPAALPPLFTVEDYKANGH